MLANEQEDALTPELISEWYNSIGFGDYVSKDVFESTVRGALYYNKKKPSKVRVTNQMIIVNYQNPRGSKHFFWFQIRPTPKMIYSSGATYGVPGEPLTATQCVHSSIPYPPVYSNEGGSHKSPKGFMYCSGAHNSAAFPISLRVGGLEPIKSETVGNSNTEGRKILIHPGSLGGHTMGCIGLDRSGGTALIDVIKKLSGSGILIYTSDGSSHQNYPFTRGKMKFSEDDVNRIAGSDTSIPGGSPIETTSSLSAFANAGEPSGDFGFGGGGIEALLGGGGALGVAAISSMEKNEDEDDPDDTFNTEMTHPEAKGGRAPLHGSDAFEECQNRASAPWETVVGEAKKESGDPAKYFKGTYVKLEREAGQNYFSPPDAVVKNMAVDNYAANERCIALARMNKDTDFGKENINTPEKYATVDNEIVCKYEGPSNQDYGDCKGLVDVYNGSIVSEADMLKTDNKDFKELAANQEANLKTGIQTDAAKVQKTLTAKKAQISLKRSNFHMAKLEAVNKAQAAMPNRNSILRDCQRYMAGRNRGKADLKAFVGTLFASPDKSIPVTPDPCLSVSKLSKVNLVQNIPARKQAIIAIEKAGLKALSLSSKQRIFMNRTNLLNSSGLRGTQNGGYDLNTSESVSGERTKFGFGKAVDWSKEGCSGGDCKYRGSGKGSLGKSGSSKRSSYDEYARVALPENMGSSSKNEKSKILTFDEAKNKRGVFDESFYTNVNLALAGKMPLSDLSKAQRKEYHALLEYRSAKNKGSSRSVRTRAQEKVKQTDGPKGKGKEIWFDTSMDLFKIISNRYQKVFDKL